MWGETEIESTALTVVPSGFVDDDDEYINEGSDESGGALGVYDVALVWPLMLRTRTICSDKRRRNLKTLFKEADISQNIQN